MIQSGQVLRCSVRVPSAVRSAVVLFSLVLLTGAACHAQDEFSGSGSEPTYSDQASTTCEKGNQNNPYAGMNPLVCHGVMAPVDSRGDCSLSGMTVLSKQGGTCYYCAAINPPIKGFIVPMDDLARADAQGFLCGVDQADPNCMAVCQGNGIFTPPPGTTLKGQTSKPAEPPANTPVPRKPLQGYVTNSPDPCEPLGPGGYNYCSNPSGTKLPAGCTCPKSQTAQPGTNKPQNPAQNAGQYLQGLVAGVGQCAKGFADLLAGSASFVGGDFTHAAQFWGLAPGQSVTLKLLSSELTTPVVGSNVTAYDQGVAAGRRICAYGIVPGVAKAGGAALKAVTAGSRANPISGAAVLEATTNNPTSLADKWVSLPTGPVQLGGFVGDGTFGAVYDYGEGNVIKLSTNNEGSAASFPRQQLGSARLKAAGVDTPTVSDFQQGGANQPSAIVEQNVTTQWPGAKQFTPQQYLELPPAQRAAVWDAINNAGNKIAAKGMVWGDGSLNNMMFQPVGDAFNVIVHDSDFVMSLPEVESAIDNLSTSVPGRVIYNALSGAQDLQALNPGYTAKSLQQALQNARIGTAPAGGDTLAPAK